MARVNIVKRAQQDYPEQGIKKGDTYYWWKFRSGGMHRSKTMPRGSQLTQSEYTGGVLSAQETVEDMKPESYEHVDDFKSDVESIQGDLESLKSDIEDKLNNMPEGLQQGDTGQLMQERIDNLDTLISEFDSLDLNEPDEDDVTEALKKDDDPVESKVDPAVVEGAGKQDTDPIAMKREAARLKLVHDRIEVAHEEILGFSWEA
jgi:hypothetical protein